LGVVGGDRTYAQLHVSAIALLWLKRSSCCRSSSPRDLADSKISNLKSQMSNLKFNPRRNHKALTQDLEFLELKFVGRSNC